MEENRRFSWSDLFIKIILVIIFVLFTVWLLSLSNKGLSNSLNVLTDNIFSENMEKMKEVGKEYFTVERLPEKVGDVKTLTLQKMYDKKLILELKDKYGNACSAENSYISIEKYDNEYQMKVYLECGEESDYIIVIMGCYDYCDTDICEKEDNDVETIEYEYMKPTGGKWSDYGKWSEWSKVSVTKTDYRQVETKKEKEEYSYDKTITEIVYEEFEVSCPSGYSLNSDKTKCYKKVNGYEYTEPVCPTVSGFTLVGRNGFTCNYSKSATETATKTASCPSGYNQSGNTCAKEATETTTKTASCPSGYDKSGNTCVKTDYKYADPVCPTVSGYTYTGRSGFTCNYSKTTSTYTEEYVTTKKGSYVPANTDTYVYREVGSAEYVYDCENSCAFRWIHTYKVYKKVYGTKTETTTKIASCPSGYDKSGNTCVVTNPVTANPTCPTVSGFTYTGRNGFTCNYSKVNTSVADPVCPTVSGFTLVGRNGFTCNYNKQVTKTTTDTASCSNGYNQSGDRCAKPVTDYDYENIIKTCPANYSKTQDETRCYREVTSTVTVTGTREVTYYRYRIREYTGGTVDYKWSTSKNDKDLLDAGYKLTGRTR